MNDNLVSNSKQTTLKYNCTNDSVIDDTIDNTYVRTQTYFSESHNGRTERTERTNTNNTATTKKHKKRRCSMSGCKKKLKLTAFPCKCGHKFCHVHQHAERHGCTFDFKTVSNAQADELIERMKCVDDKIDRL